MLGRVKKVVQGALANADVPIQQVVSELNISRNTAYAPVFQAMFVLGDFGAAVAGEKHVEVGRLQCSAHETAARKMSASKDDM